MFFILSLISSSFAGQASVFNGNNIKLLKSNLDLNGSAQIITGTVDPTSSATNATTGSIYLDTSTGDVYKKNDNGLTTNWSKFGASSTAGTLIVDGYWPAAVSGCSLQRGSNATPGTFTAGTTSGCGAFVAESTGPYTVTGNAANSPNLIVTSLDPGTYEVDVIINGASASGSDAGIGVGDGTTISGFSSWKEFSSIAAQKQTRAYFTYSSISTITFSVVAAVAGSNWSINQLGNVAGGGSTRMTIKRLQ